MSVSILEFEQQFCEEHIAEATFLFDFRRKAIFLSELKLFDFLRFDKRLLGHLRGLSIRPDIAWPLVHRQIDDAGPTDALLFVAGFLAFTAKNANWRAAYLAILGACRKLALIDDVVAWLGQSEKATIFQDESLRTSSAGWHTLLACANGSAVLPSVLSALPKGSPTSLLCAALRSVGANRQKAFRDAAIAHTRHEELAVRVEALRAALRLGEPGTHRQIWESDWGGLPPLADIFPLAILHTPVGELPTALDRLIEVKREREAVICAAYSGQTVFIPYIVKMMENPALARYAGAAFRAMTGVDVSSGDTKSTAEGDSEAPEDSASVMLLMPDIHKANAWLADHVMKTTGETPILDGQTISSQALMKILRDGPQFQRTIAASRAFQLGMDNVGLNSCDLAHVQRKQLEKVANLTI